MKKDDEETNYTEAAYVDPQYEYLLKNKDNVITFEEYCRKARY